MDQKRGSSVLCIFGLIWSYRMRKWILATSHCWGNFFMTPFLIEGVFLQNRAENVDYICRDGTPYNKMGHKNVSPTMGWRQYSFPHSIWSNESKNAKNRTTLFLTHFFKYRGLAAWLLLGVFYVLHQLFPRFKRQTGEFMLYYVLLTSFGRIRCISGFSIFFTLVIQFQSSITQLEKVQSP